MDVPSTAVVCAARSPIARRDRATGWCRAAGRSTSSTSRGPNGSISRERSGLRGGRSMPEPRGAAVVGLGIGTMHVRALRRLRDRFTVVAVCDPDEARSQPVAERLGAVACSFDEMLARDDVAVVHIGPPPAMHLEQ